MSKLRELMDDIVRAGGTPFFVGGSVRDSFLDLGSKDLDIEVYGLRQDKVAEIVSRHCDGIKFVGKSFGVLKASFYGLDLDIALPRSEVKIASGHRGFDVTTDPFMDKKEACRRRDFTFNAMMIEASDGDRLTGNFFDFFGGIDDIENGVIRHVDDVHFQEDPLRCLRAFQFAGRFGWSLAEETAMIMAGMIGQIRDLPVERIWEEWYKWAVKSTVPSAGIQALLHSTLVSLYPEIEALDGLKQDRQHHPEGDALVHTMLALDKTVEIADREGLSGDDRAVLVFSALCHDFGKASTTARDENGRITTHGHDKAGVGPAGAFLARIGAPQQIVDRVCPLVERHMSFRFGDSKVTDRSVRRLARKIAPATISEIVMLMEADAAARPPIPAGDCHAKLAERSANLSIVSEPPKPILMGRHLIDLGMKPGPKIGALISRSFEAQLDGEFEDETGAISWAKKELKSGF